MLPFQVTAGLNLDAACPTHSVRKAYMRESNSSLYAGRRVHFLSLSLVSTKRELGHHRLSSDINQVTPLLNGIQITKGSFHVKAGLYHDSETERKQRSR